MAFSCLRSIPFKRASIFITDFSVTGFPTSISFSKKYCILTGWLSSLRSLRTLTISRAGILQAVAHSAALLASVKYCASSGESMVPSLLVSMAPNNFRKVSNCSCRSSSALLILSSSSCFSVVEIMLSLTTAVKMDNRVQELVIMKKTKPNLSVGIAPIRPSIATASSSDWAPFMSLKSKNMLSGTVAKGSKMLSSISDASEKIIPWPMRRVAMMATA
mmetsp:Transcript_19532/g.41615  ORF Transcript_19532/g.41615 Transcript_19532/m.41615 type:complete len:218 (-) Transcript_19532:96-749(-)